MGFGENTTSEYIATGYVHFRWEIIWIKKYRLARIRWSGIKNGVKPSTHKPNLIISWFTRKIKIRSIEILPRFSIE